MPSESPFDATASLTGYLYQVRMALVLLLQRYRLDPGIAVTIEKFDDIAFHNAIDVMEQLQTKHVTHKNLSDSSTDLWKTIRVWSQGYRLGTIDPTSTNLILLTTAEAPPGSAASYLRPTDRNYTKAQEILEEIAKKSINKANESAYQEFQRLTKGKRAQLLKSSYVHDRSPAMLQVKALLRQELLLSTKASKVPAMASRLEGWWFQVVVEHLAGLRARIAGDELEATIDDLREQFKIDNLPIDYADLHVPGTEKFDGRTFVQQLSSIELAPKRIARAILDYYRAVKQRGRWINDQLIGEQELRTYERKLRETWAEIFDSKVQSAASDGAVTGRDIYDTIMVFKEIALRPSCTEPYVMRGSYQMLADNLTVGWHPHFQVLFKDFVKNDK